MSNTKTKSKINMNEKLRHVIFMVSSVVKNTITDKVVAHLIDENIKVLASPRDESKAPVETVKKFKLPSRKNIPLSITPKGEKLWNMFWDKYDTDLKKMVKKSESPEKAWAACVAFFRNFCLKRNVYPFESETTQKISEDTTTYLQNRLSTGRSKIFNKVKQTIKILKNINIKTVNKEIIDFVGYDTDKSRFELVSLVTCPLEDKKIDTLLGNTLLSNSLKTKGFTKKRSGSSVFYVWTEGPLEVIVGAKNKGNLGIWLTQHYTTQQARLMCNYNEDFVPSKDKKATSSVASSLAKIFKKLLKETGNISRVTVKGNVKATVLPGQNNNFDIDIDNNNILDALNKDEQSALDLTIKELKNTPVPQIIQNYTLDLIRSLGSVSYQYALLTELVGVLIEKKVNVPALWLTAQNEPEKYLNQDDLADIEDNASETADI